MMKMNDTSMNGYSTYMHQGNTAADGSQQNYAVKSNMGTIAKHNLSNAEIIQLYMLSFDCLDIVYKREFRKSNDYLSLVEDLNSNMIEYRFFAAAGLENN